jgi:hypothetical protein
VHISAVCHLQQPPSRSAFSPIRQSLPASQTQKQDDAGRRWRKKHTASMDWDETSAKMPKKHRLPRNTAPIPTNPPDLACVCSVKVHFVGSFSLRLSALFRHGSLDLGDFIRGIVRGWYATGPLGVWSREPRKSQLSSEVANTQIGGPAGDEMAEAMLQALGWWWSSKYCLPPLDGEPWLALCVFPPWPGLFSLRVHWPATDLCRPRPFLQ